MLIENEIYIITKLIQLDLQQGYHTKLVSVRFCSYYLNLGYQRDHKISISLLKRNMMKFCKVYDKI